MFTASCVLSAFGECLFAFECTPEKWTLSHWDWDNNPMKRIIQYALTWVEHEYMV